MIEIMNRLPHRILANHSLHKTADKVRAKSAEYEEKTKRYEEEILQAQKQSEKKVREVGGSVTKVLYQEEKKFAGLQKALCEYIKLYFEKELQDTLRRNKIGKKKMLEEHNAFLWSEINLISGSIREHKNTKNILSKQADVKEFIELMRLNSNMDLNNCTDAESLLKRVNQWKEEMKASGITLEDRFCKVREETIWRLDRVVRECTELLAQIQYIDWVISQKRQQEKGYKEKTKKIQSEIDIIEDEVKECKVKSERLSEKKKIAAEKVRYYWERPMMQVNAEITWIEKSKSEYVTELHEVNNEINKMKEEHSSDRLAWDELHRKKDSLRHQISRIDAEVKSKEEELAPLRNIKSGVYEICKANNVRFIWGEKKEESDEYIILLKRLQEIEDIILKGEKEAEEKWVEKKKKIEEEYRPKVEDEQANYKEANNKVAIEIAIRDKYQRQDGRLILLKALVPSPKVKEVNKRIYNAEKERDDAICRKKKFEKEYDEKIKKCKKKTSKAVKAAKEERKVLELRKQKLLENYRRV